MRLLLSAWTWCVLVVFSVLATAAVLATRLVTFPFDRNRYYSGRAFRRIAAFAIAWVPLWRFSARAPYPQQLPRACVVVANHESHLDAFLISHLPWEMKWLAKSSLFKIPFIGWSMALAGDVAVVRGKRDSVEEALKVCRRYLDRGMSVFLFPEGTRTKNDELQPFKSGAFALALQARVPVLPLAVAGTRGGLPKGAFVFGACRALVQVGTPIDPDAYLAGYSSEDAGERARAIEALQAQARGQIEPMRRALRAELGLAGAQK